MSDWRGLTDWFVDRPGQLSQVGALREATEGPLIFRTANPLGFASEREEAIVRKASVVYSRV
jgi:hypothetical protein